MITIAVLRTFTFVTFGLRISNATGIGSRVWVFSASRTRSAVWRSLRCLPGAAWTTVGCRWRRTTPASIAFRSRWSLSKYERMRARETSTSSGMVTPGRADSARRIAFEICAFAPSASGATSMRRVGLTTSGSGCSNVFRTSFVACAGVSQPTRTGPTLTPAEMRGRFAGGVGEGVVVVVVTVVVGPVVVVPVSAPAVPGENTNAETKPSAAQTASETAPTARTPFLTPAV
jgi:hypothetical protein